MAKFLTKKLINKIFEAGIIIKAFFGIFEIMGGLLFAISKKIITNNFIISMSQDEIAEDPNDLIANYLINISNSLAQDSRIFAVAYLLFHGAINIFLAISLAKEKIKTYPTIITVLCAFIFYQTYKYIHTNSLMLLALTIFDLAFTSIILLEYKKKKHAKTKS